MSDCRDLEGKTSDEKNQVRDNISHNFNYAYSTFAWLKLATVLVGLGIVFIWRK